MPATDLPYYCPEFRSGHLKPPCNGNLAKIKELQEKGQKYFGVLDKCQECQGLKLQKVDEKPIEQAQPQDGENMRRGLPSDETERRNLILSAIRKLIERDGQATRKSLAAELGLPMNNLYYHLNRLEGGGYIKTVKGETPTSAVTIQLNNPPQESPALKELTPKQQMMEREVAPGFCEKHPEENRIILGQGNPVEGKIPGECRSCAQGKPPTAKKEALPPSETPPPASSPSMTTESTDATDTSQVTPRPCKNCGVEKEIIDRLGRPMGVCKKCLSQRARPNLALGSAHGWQPFNIPLNNPKYEEILKWLQEAAEELEQELWQQVMFQLKLAYRRGTNIEQEAN